MNTPTTPKTLVVNAAEIIGRAQEALFAYLPPDSGLTAEQVISNLLRILDGPECRVVTAKAKLDEASRALEEDRRKFNRATAELFIRHHAEQLAKYMAAAEPAPQASQAGKDPATTIARLRDELARRREHETHLIEARDRLLKQSAEQAEEVIRLRAVIDHARNNLKV